MDSQELFWDKWLKADELERLKLVQTLPMFKEGIQKEKGIIFAQYVSPTLLNSYFEDLYKRILYRRDCVKQGE